MAAEGLANYANTFGFVPNSQVFDLPAGYMVNVTTPEGSIVNNFFNSSPEPGSLGRRFHCGVRAESIFAQRSVE